MIQLLLRSFLGDRRGNVIILFGLTIIPIMGFIGGAIDFNRAYGVRTSLQASLDAAVLAAGTVGDYTDAERIEIGQKAFAANALAKKLGRVGEPTIKFGSDGLIKGAVSANMDTYVLGVMGIDHLDVGVESVARLPNKVKAEIALVLDYSGSMNRNGKYQAMRGAAIDLLNIMMEQSDETKFGLVPFSEYIYTDMQTDYIRGVHPDKYGNVVTACLNSRRHPYATKESTPFTAIQDSKWSAPGMPKEWTEPGALTGNESVNEEVQECTDLAASETAKCTATEDAVVDQCKIEEVVEEDQCDLLPKAQQNACKDAAEDKADLCLDQASIAKNSCNANVAKLQNADQCLKETAGNGVQSEKSQSDFANVSPQCADYRDRSVQIQPLTTDKTLLVGQLNVMTPIKMTNIALALEHGWHMVSPNEPFVEGVSYGTKDMLKAIVLLSDGTQTVGGYGPGNSFNNAQADQNTRDLCDGIKAKGIILMTVAFDLANNGTAYQLLSKCASGSEYFFDAQTNAELAAAFKNIATKLQKNLALVQ